ncbi:MAG: SDR family NAD(P)-dependent oxidoreductase, partial [Nanoarchaeota archaeon]
MNFKNSWILICGASGSIGSALSRKISKLKPKKLLLCDQDESGLFDIYEELKELCKTEFIIANIRDKEKINSIFKKYKPDLVFNCAALKHVVLCERWPDEAIKTNIEGLENLIESAKKYKVKKFIQISSDKAANPISV